MQKRRAKIEKRDLSAVLEVEFSYRMLNDLFFEHVGAFRGARTLFVGGIAVTKYVSHAYKSNSGKSRDSEVEISWVGSDGQKRTVSNGGSRYRANRRNDAERDWGLPE